MSYERVTPCVKIDRKVAFNIASEASYVYILNGQKFIKNDQFDKLFRTKSLRSNSATRQVTFDRKNCWKMPKFI